MNLDELMLAHWSPSATTRRLASDLLPALAQQAQEHFSTKPDTDFPDVPAGLDEVDDRFEKQYERQKSDLGELWKSAGAALDERLREGVAACEDEMSDAVAAASEHPHILADVVHEWMWFTKELMELGKTRYRSRWSGRSDWEETQWRHARNRAFWDVVIAHVPLDTVPLSGPSEVMDWAVVYQQVKARALRHPASDLPKLRPWLEKLDEWGGTLGQAGTRWSCSSARHLGFTKDGLNDPDDRCDQARRLDHEASSENRKALREAQSQPESLRAWQAWLLERGVPPHPTAFRDWPAIIRTLSGKKLADVQAQQQGLEDLLGEGGLDPWLVGPTPDGGIAPEQAFEYMKPHPTLSGLVQALTHRQVARRREAAAPSVVHATRDRPRMRS